VTAVDAALVREQGVNFAVLSVKAHVLNSPTERTRVVQSFAGVVGGRPVVLMAQDARGRATFWGRSDIVRFLSAVPLGALPWRRYDLH
jgi:hypothetical protein